MRPLSGTGEATDSASFTCVPTRAGDPEYIVKLVGRVIRVSLETVRIVNSLPPF